MRSPVPSRKPIAAPRRKPAPAPSPGLVLQRLGARVRAARTARGESRGALAARSGLSVRFLAQLEAGDANISVLRLLEVAEALGLDLRRLLTADDDEAPASRSPETRLAIDRLLHARTPPELREVHAWLAARFAAGRGPLVALLGLRGAGKSSVGRRLAQRLGVPFFELDERIETAAGLRLEQIFELQGEDAYRRLERQALERFLAETPAGVLATGGGLVTEPSTFALLRRRCLTVWLRAAPELHWQRVVRQGDRRPMRDNPAAMHELRALLAAREPLYAQADLSLDTSGRTVAAVATRLAAAVRRSGTRHSPS